MTNNLLRFLKSNILLSSIDFEGEEENLEYISPILTKHSMKAQIYSIEWKSYWQFQKWSITGSENIGK